MENPYNHPQDDNNRLENIHNNYFMASHPIPNTPSHKRMDFPGVYLNDFEAKLMRSLICSICKKTLEQPVTDPCGHSFCSECIFISRQFANSCPVTKKEYSNRKVYCAFIYLF